MFYLESRRCTRVSVWLDHTGRRWPLTREERIPTARLSAALSAAQCGLHSRRQSAGSRLSKDRFILSIGFCSSAKRKRLLSYFSHAGWYSDELTAAAQSSEEENSRSDGRHEATQMETSLSRYLVVLTYPQEQDWSKTGALGNLKHSSVSSVVSSRDAAWGLPHLQNKSTFVIFVCYTNCENSVGEIICN